MNTSHPNQTQHLRDICLQTSRLKVMRVSIKVRNQATKCSFGRFTQKANDINIKDEIIDSWAPIEIRL